jgi:tRNA(Ile)-lysidine synthase
MASARTPNRKPHRRKPLSEFAARLAAEWRRLGLVSSGERVLVAVSGGADSTALLLAIAELLTANKLRLVPIVVHLDHRLRRSSKEDADWVADLAAKLGFRAVVSSANIKKRAKDTADNLEQAARRSRYEFFQKTAAAEKAKLLLTAHTLDDQAETILMRLIRGSAAEGLSGTESVRPIEPGSSVLVARPLLSWARRSETEQYCRARKIRYRVDEMNDDERFARVKVRKQLLPLMQSFNNRIVDALARTATLLREDAAALSEQANQLLAAATKNPPETSKTYPKRPLNLSIVAQAPSAIRRRALRLWIGNEVGHLRRIEMVHLFAVEKLLEGNRGRSAELPGGVSVTRRRGWLYLTVKRVDKAPRKL